ncbi:SDR family NAD(P)-dependent oxidoreductase [Streptomyces sp. NRRL B-24484]|uniref:SDR family NAD(P)-dependent oxidoreductase n=1 Tax=Streptomyces sp. NRRL B-24484 TaxID=1463833 RepID=UPI001F203380|nr:SDR family oxidoreductase [Streptomyces sp. NRRL B-24484]
MICARDPQEPTTAERELSRRGTVASTVCDLADPDAPERLVAATVERFGRFDVLVNNAGLIKVGPLQAFGAEDFDRALDVMVRAPIRLVLAALPGMRERRSGTIVTVSSIGGRIPAPHLLPYVAAKFAPAGLSAGLRAELAADGIGVTTVLSGLMRTGFHRAAAFAGRPEHEYARFAPAASLPLLSMDAARAARAIVRAAERGRPELVLTRPPSSAAGCTASRPPPPPGPSPWPPACCPPPAPGRAARSRARTPPPRPSTGTRRSAH